MTIYRIILVAYLNGKFYFKVFKNAYEKYLLHFLCDVWSKYQFHPTEFTHSANMSSIKERRFE